MTDREMPSTTFSAFYEDEMPGQVRRATILTGDPDTAHDLVHDAFVEVYRRWESLAEAGPYLNRAVLNRCRDHARTTRRRAARLPLFLPDATAPEHDLFDAVQALPFNHRAAIVLRYHYQFTEAEIAAVLSCRPGSVGPWLQRGLRRLRKDLS